MPHIDHIGISVADLDRMTEWYTGAFGLNVRQSGTIPGVGIRTVLLADSEGAWGIELLHREGSAGMPRPTDPDAAVLTQGYGHVCLRVDDAAAAYDALVAAGAASLLPPRAARRAGAQLAYVADPEGNLIELIDRDLPSP